MIKKFCYFFSSSVLLLVFTAIQPVFAGFKVTVINQSDIVYDSIELIMTAVGFDAPYGRITLNTRIINPGEQAIQIL